VISHKEAAGNDIPAAFFDVPDRGLIESTFFNHLAIL